MRALAQPTNRGRWSKKRCSGSSTNWPASPLGEHIAIGPRLAELGWSDIEAEYPIEACELLFRAQGRSLAQTDCLDRVMLAELAGARRSGRPRRAARPGPRTTPRAPTTTGSPASCSGHLTDAAAGRPGVGRRWDGVDRRCRRDGCTASAWTPSTRRRLDAGERVRWTPPLVDASTEWNRAIAAAHRALATEFVALAEQALRIAVEHVSVRVQFGAPIGSFQSPRHALADASAAPGRRAGAARRVLALRRPALGADRQGRRRAGAPRGHPTPHCRCAARSG